MLLRRAAGVVAGLTALRIVVLLAFAVLNDASLTHLLTQWDADYYLDIATEGYTGERSYAFFPGFPALLALLGGSPIAALILNFGATIALAMGVMWLCDKQGGGTRTQLAAAVVVCGAPMSTVFLMPYTEALFCALSVWALIALQDKRWWLTAVLIGAAGTVRLTAAALLVAFGICVLLWARKNWRAWAALILASLPPVAFIAWASWRLGSVDGYFANQSEHWDSGFDFGLATLRWVGETLTTATNAGYLLSTLVILAVPLTLALTWRRQPLPVAVFALALCINVLAADGIMHSRPRLLLPAAIILIPVVIAAFRRLPTPWAWTFTTAWALFGAWFSGYMLAVFEWAI
ncbi:mannosyltransferase family protein [Corynebacterium camporealensis]|uniref:PIG-V mannosyltransferase n=1 Tax=Corynebacterium camporealensis TaxID=161896 RepID=A0A0F6T9J0_9CORY|nr:mannosyltransferase family protein [Corynebacterium camporealensis]AKE38156.1 PIG-V mannosyltransferase [Corynebacterium camporealensis]